MRLVCTTVLMLACGLAHASGQTCDSKTIVTQAWPDATLMADNTMRVGAASVSLKPDTPHSVLCKVWPAWPELTLAAVPLITTPDDAEDYQSGDLELLLLDSTSLAVQQRLRLKRRMDDDALSISRLALDTARWKLAPDSKVFGLRVEQSTRSHANPFKDISLALFAIEGNTLRPVLDGIGLARLTGEWNEVCRGNILDTTRSLSVSDTRSQGYADIIVNENRVASVFNGSNADCVPKETHVKTRYHLRYNGSTYTVPEKLTAMPY